ncbi:MAG: hypothetical protein L0338_35975 [Acidobacteria bacterium]|nr:hypothetical protein [Acidobacteriota bacterium]
MPEKRVSDLFRIRNRFLRSAHLERDFQDPSAFSGYVLTDFARSCLGRVAYGLKPRSGQRAWRVTGDYGSGKSSFALLLAHLFAGYASSLRPEIRRAVDYHELGVSRPHFLPVLVTCSRQALGISILQSVHSALVQAYGRVAKSRLAGHVQSLIDSRQEPTEEEVYELILEVNRRIISDSKSKGLLLILDELGKFLEFAALHPERQDIYLLQRLAEAASRSGDEPLFVVCLLHQGFNAYADILNQPAQREWEKIAGRFEEIVFNQPVEQVTNLIASALNVSTQEIPRGEIAKLKHAMGRIIEIGWFGSPAKKSLLDCAPRLYPLHPTVLPVLIRVFRRFGQNERSLFSFLLSNEPFGLQAFAQRGIRSGERYRLHNFYDYVRMNFGHRIAVHSYRSHWNLIDSVIESFSTEDEIQVKVLKTVGILNLLNDADLLPRQEAIVCAISGDDAAEQTRVRAALDRLHRESRILYDRGRARGLCLWPHTSVDLEKAYDDACRAVDTPQRVAALIKDSLETRGIVARRHYIETGNLRHWDVRYCSVMQLGEFVAQATSQSDGVVLVPLCETIEERKAVLDFVNRPDVRERPNMVLAVPQPLNNLGGLVQEMKRWEWVSTNTLELNADKYAREEVSRQKAAAHLQLQKRIQSFIGWKQLNGQMMLEWFHQGSLLDLKDGRQLLARLSRIFDDVYAEAPRIHNELVNRRNPSSAAAAARMRLIERMFTNRTEIFLGMDSQKKPPEMSMYLSVLKSTGLHQKHGDSWQIGEPHHRRDRCNVLPALRRIREIVQAQPDSRINVAGLFEQLRKPPYGVRDGIIPLFLTVFAIAHDKDIAFYKDGSFVRELSGEAMLVLTKAPERFDIQYCKIEGVRAQLFQKLLAVLEIKQSRDREAELLDVVKKLCVFVAQLPTYVVNTRKLSPVALAVRDVILNAREPAKLVFAGLPQACGFDPIGTDVNKNKPVHLFVNTLKGALDELRAAFPCLQDRIRGEISRAFDLPSQFPRSRTELAARAQEVLLTVTESKLRAFCLRLMDDKLPESDWLESVGSYLALKPPSKWHDMEEDLFSSELAQFATRFRRVESILFAKNSSPTHAVGVRLAITQANGVEHEQVVHFAADEEQQLRELQTQFGAILARDPRLGLAAASRAIWTALEKGDVTKHE